jgi:hypothetical protein
MGGPDEHLQTSWTNCSQKVSHALLTVHMHVHQTSSYGYVAQKRTAPLVPPARQAEAW